jgi:putative nucleotidyltransferase with HDIG domain
MCDDTVDRHSGAVARYAAALGRELGLTPRDLATLTTAALCHDLGKAAIPASILDKPGPLTAEEYGVLQRHVVIGARALAAVGLGGEVARIVGEHHERYDGGGYPAGKHGAEISLGGRIVAVADALDAMLTDRCYARRRTLAAALAELARCAGSQFDPAVVAAAYRLAAGGALAFAPPAALRPALAGVA